MKRSFAIPALFVAALALVPVLHADVKTRERSQMKFEGMGLIGPLLNRAMGDMAKDGLLSTVAVKGNRMSRVNDLTGEIIDLSEEKVYKLDVKKKEYTVSTFAQLRQQFRDAQEKASKDAKGMSPEDKNSLDNSGKQIEFEADVKETGQHKTVAGQNAREVILTITAHEKGKKIEDSGGFIMTNDMWIGPKVAALDELTAFQMKYFQAVYGDLMTVDPQNMASFMAMFPSFGKMAAQMQTEGKKLEGTTLLTTSTFETVKSDQDMKAASSQSSSGGGGGGLGGMLASRIARGRGGPAQQKSTLMTVNTEKLSIETSASADDVAIPAGFKEKK